MSELIARTALKKARYFLAQAAAAQNDVKILNDRLPFAANLEAVIIYARSSLDHLRNELKPAHNEAGYKRWHQGKYAELKKTSSLFEYFTDRRDYIIHQEPEKTNTQISAEAHLSIGTSMSVSVTVTRVNGTVEDHGLVARCNPVPSTAAVNTAQGETTQTFFFADQNWREKSAVAYVSDFIGACEAFVCEAESKFI